MIGPRPTRTLARPPPAGRRAGNRWRARRGRRAHACRRRRRRIRSLHRAERCGDRCSAAGPDRAGRRAGRRRRPPGRGAPSTRASPNRERRVPLSAEFDGAPHRRSPAPRLRIRGVPARSVTVLAGVRPVDRVARRSCSGRPVRSSSPADRIAPRRGVADAVATGSGGARPVSVRPGQRRRLVRGAPGPVGRRTCAAPPAAPPAAGCPVDLDASAA